MDANWNLSDRCWGRLKNENELYFNQGQVLDVMMSSWFSSSFSTSQNREKKQIATHEVSTPNKNRLFAKLNMGKNFIVSSRASLTTPRLLPLKLSRRSYGNYQSSQSFGSSQNFLIRRGQSGRSGRSYRNQALEDTDGDYTHQMTRVQVLHTIPTDFFCFLSSLIYYFKC